jgi:hypothetical protein
MECIVSPLIGFKPWCERTGITGRLEFFLSSRRLRVLYPNNQWIAEPILGSHVPAVPGVCLRVVTAHMQMDFFEWGAFGWKHVDMVSKRESPRRRYTVVGSYSTVRAAPELDLRRLHTTTWEEASDDDDDESASSDVDDSSSSASEDDAVVADYRNWAAV